MPVSGFKTGDRVLTPSGKLATVTAISTRGASTARVRYDALDEEGYTVHKTFRQSALRLWDAVTGEPVNATEPADNFRVERQHSGTEDGPLFYVVTPDGSKVSGDGYIDEDGARCELAELRGDTATVAEIAASFAASAVAGIVRRARMLEGQTPDASRGEVGARLFADRAANLIREAEDVARDLTPEQRADMLRQVPDFVLAGFELDPHPDMADEIAAEREARSVPRYVCRMLGRGDSLSWAVLDVKRHEAIRHLTGSNARELAAELNRRPDLRPGVGAWQSTRGWALDPCATIEARRVARERDAEACARCDRNPAAEGSSLCDPCETGLEIAQETGQSRAAVNAANARADTLGLQRPDDPPATAPDAEPVKWLLSYDGGEVASHPYTLLSVRIEGGTFTPLEAIQMTSLDNALAALRDPSRIAEWRVT